MTVGPLVHSSPATDPNLVGAPFLTLGAVAALSGEFSVRSTDPTNLTADIFYRWNSVSAQAFRIDNIGAGVATLGVNTAAGSTDGVRVGIAGLDAGVDVRGTKNLTAPSILNTMYFHPAIDLLGFNMSALAMLRLEPSPDDTVGGGVITDMRMIDLNPQAGAATITTFYYIDGRGSPGGSSYGVKMIQLFGSPISRLLELGAPYLRLLDRYEWTPTAEQTPLYLVEGAVPTLRNVQWVDPGAAGANLVAGQRVMVLV